MFVTVLEVLNGTARTPLKNLLSKLLFAAWRVSLTIATTLL